MGAAAHPLLVDRICDWLEELERILHRFDEMSETAHAAIASVVQSILQETDITDAEAGYVSTLWARHSARSDTPRRERA
jgi:hypothetical protein